MKLKFLGVNFPHKKGEFCQKAKFPHYTICCFYTPFLYLDNGKMVKGERGDIIINTPYQTVYHGPRYESEEGFINDWIHIEGDDIGLLLEKYPLPLNKAFHIDEWTSLRKYYNYLLSEYNEKTAGSFDMIESIMTQMIITMHRAYKKQNVFNDVLDQISTVRQEIIKNPAKKWTLNEMAEISGYSVSRFSELYRKAYNISPVNDVIEQRISSAKKLLLSGQVSVSQVAHMCGFNSINYFSKFFKASTGYAPSEYIKYFMENTWLQKHYRKCFWGASGIVRRIDDLGKVVIPKEIRRTMKIREGYPSQILTLTDFYIALHNIVDRYEKAWWVSPRFNYIRFERNTKTKVQSINIFYRVKSRVSIKSKYHLADIFTAF